MGQNPYEDLPESAFWRTGVAQENPYSIRGIYKKKFDISSTTKIAAAGSCFAQHISRHLKKNGYKVLDVEPAPQDLPKSLHQKFGYSMYSARYGNIYTVRQLLQLAQEVSGDRRPENTTWAKQGRYFDALRPSVEPEGLDSAEEVVEHRRFHLERVYQLFKEMDLFIFTLGLTEMWVHKASGTVYPTAPGTIVGDFDDAIYEFQNAEFTNIIEDFNKFQEVVNRIRGGRSFKILLTVSPVPLTASASREHVLVSTCYSKSTLRSAAGKIALDQNHIDYFPSYEIVTNPRLHSTSFSENLRTVRDETVENVMRHFFESHGILSLSADQNLEASTSLGADPTVLQCEELVLEVFGKEQ